MGGWNIAMFPVAPWQTDRITELKELIGESCWAAKHCEMTAASFSLVQPHPAGVAAHFKWNLSVDDNIACDVGGVVLLW